LPVPVADSKPPGRRLTCDDFQWPPAPVVLSTAKNAVLLMFVLAAAESLPPPSMLPW